MTRQMVITGGGTGGHTSAALAVAVYAKERLCELGIELLWVTSRSGIEKAVAIANNIDQFSVRCSPLPRRLAIRDWIAMARVLLGSGQCIARFARNRPLAVLSFGGYVAAPAVVAAVFLRIPLFVHEQTTVVGTANRLTGYFAKEVYLSHKNSTRWFRPSKCVVTGNPVRSEVYRCDHQSPSSLFGLSDTIPILYVTGGSQGARELNLIVWRELPGLLRRWQLIHQTGRQPDNREQVQKALERVPLHLRERYYHTDYVEADRIGCCYAAASFVFGRAGAATTDEIRTLGLPCILVPYPYAKGQEQLHNAQSLAMAGLATILESHELDTVDLPQLLDVKLSSVPQDRRRVTVRDRQSSPEEKILSSILAQLDS